MSKRRQAWGLGCAFFEAAKLLYSRGLRCAVGQLIMRLCRICLCSWRLSFLSLGFLWLNLLGLTLL
ncbi:hypothetical protein AYI88_11560 [Shewanella algae]|nr:hypothetical protein AYI88_11560 [Shewanella algae]